MILLPQARLSIIFSSYQYDTNESSNQINKKNIFFQVFHEVINILSKLGVWSILLDIGSCSRVRRIRSVYPEISVYALQSGNFCIRCVSGYVWTLVSVYFCIRWRNAHALLTNPLRCPDTNRIRVDGRIRFVYATCGRRYFVSA